MSVDRALTGSELSGHPIAVAYVDDYEEFGDLAADGLEDACGHLSVTTITDPSAVTDRLDQFDCIVSDYDMPRTDGLELLRQVRVLDDDIPFILFTGEGSEGVASDAISLGVTDYLTKSGGQERFVRLANRIESAVKTKRATEAVQQTRTKAKETIRRERARFRALIEHSPAMTAVLDESGRVRFASPSTEDVIGFKPRDLQGENAFEYVHDEDADRLVQEFQRSLENPEYRPVAEYRFQHRNGDWVNVESKGVNRLDDPAVEGFIVNTRDVTEQRETERRLRRERDFAERMLEVSPTPILALDADGEVLRANRRAAEIIGRSVDELVGSAADSSIEIRTPEGDVVPPHELIAPKVVTSGESESGVEYHATLPTGEYRIVASAAPLSTMERHAAVVSIDEFELLENGDKNT